MSEFVNDPIRDGSPSELRALSTIEQNPPLPYVVIGPATTLRIAAAVSACSHLKPTAHGAGIAIHYPDARQMQEFGSGSDRDDGSDTWADRGMLGAALITYEWVERYAPEASVTASACNHQYVVTQSINMLQQVKDEVELELHLQNRKNVVQLRKLFRLVKALPNVTWKPMSALDTLMKRAKKLAKSSSEEASRRLGVKGIAVTLRPAPDPRLFKAFKEYGYLPEP